MPVKHVIASTLAALAGLVLVTGAPPRAERPAADDLRVDAVSLPVRYVADRYYLAPATAQGGDTLLLYTDTGGGANMLYTAAVGRLNLETELLVLGGDSTRLALLPPMAPDAAVPPPNLLPPFGDRLLVTDPQEGYSFGADGLLGRTWFAGRVWDFDFPNRSLGLVMGYDRRAASILHYAELGFQTDPNGRRTTHFPRMSIMVDGDSIDLLFDTGATIRLTDTALAQLDDGGPAERATSFIAESIFRQWRERHPTWRVVEHADRTLDAPMIEVPEITVAGYVVGSVWFTMRQDASFHEYMSQWMDRRVDGALGGSALRYFRVIMDYPNAVAVFDRP